MKKRLLSTLLALCMALSLLPGTAWAAEVDSGTSGDTLTRTLDSYGSVRITLHDQQTIPKENGSHTLSATFRTSVKPEDTATEENVLEVLRQYDTDAYHIMKTETDSGSGVSFLVWFIGESLISGMGTGVHETYHLYTMDQSSGAYRQTIYLGDGKSYDVDGSVAYQGAFTKTEEMARQIPPQLQTMRYYMYVVPGSITDANTRGVFGLLNEFTAYYWGLETMNSLAQFLIDADAGGESWWSYFSSIGNNMTAYAEFKYWTLGYMLYIKSANPSLYQSILNNENYCAAYRDAEIKFASEIARSKRIVNECTEYLTSKGHEVEWTDSRIYLWVKDPDRDGSRTGSGANLEEYNAIMAELQKAEYIEMDSILKHTSAPAPSAKTAYASTQTVDIDGRKVEFQMYALKDANGNDTNYIKVRDLALVLNGTQAQFNVSWDGAVNLVTGVAYQSNGTEGKTPFSGNRSYTFPTAPTNVDGAASDLQAIQLTDDAGGGYTYYQLRDLGRKLGFNVGWSSERGVYIESDKPYSR